MERFDDAYKYQFVDEAADERNVPTPPIGIDGGEVLDTMSGEELLKARLLCEAADIKSFWKTAWIDTRFWATGGFREMFPREKRTTPYPWTRDGMIEFYHDRGSTTTEDEITRHIKLYRTYSKYDVTVVRLVERAGISKAYLAIPHVRDEWVKEMLEVCIDTPYSKLRDLLNMRFKRADGGRPYKRKSKEQQRRDDETRAMRTVSDSDHGMLRNNERAIFICRRYPQESLDELRAQLVFDRAQHRLGINDRDTFFMRVVDLIWDRILLPEDRTSIDAQLAAHRSGDAARKAMGH